jgi:hypothetical protein
VRRLRVQIDLARAQLRKRHVRAGGSHGSEGGQPRRVTCEQRHARLALPGGDVLDGDVLDDHRRHAGDEPGSSHRPGDPVGVGLREVAGTGRPRCIGGDRADVELGGAAWGDDLVGAAERGGRGRANRPAHAVAGGQRGGDDRGTKHRADDDQRAASGTATQVANAEPDEDAVAQRENADHPQHRDQGDAESGGECPDGQSEQLGHGRTPPLKQR